MANNSNDYFIVLLQYLNENKNIEIGFEDLADKLSIPKQFRQSSFNLLWNQSLIDGKPAMKNPLIKINKKGIERLNEITSAQQKTERTKEVEELNYKKLKLDTKIAERVFKTYPSTRRVMWITLWITIILALLKLAEALHIWPYHK